MYIRLALRNFKRQMGSYAVYFVTVLITISLAFSLNNIVYSSEILKTVTESALSDDMKKTAAIEGITIFSGIIALINSRAQIYLLSLRKRELGTYLLLGMKRKEISKLFILESTVLFSVTIVTGLVLGMIMYQGVMSLLYSFMGMQFKLTGYSLKTFLATTIQVLIIFVVSALSTAEILKKSNITNLIEDRRKKVSKLSKAPLKRSVAFLIFCIIFWILVTLLSDNLKKFLTDDSSDSALSVVICGVIMILLPVTIIVFNMAYPRCITEMMMRIKKFSGKGTNMFVLRQLSDKTCYNSSMFASIGVMVTIVVIFINVICMDYCMSDGVAKTYPCNMITKTENLQSVEKSLDKFTDITDKIQYNKLLAVQINSMKNCTVISESNCCEVMKMVGEEPVRLNGTYKIAVRSETDDIMLKQNGFNLETMKSIHVENISSKYSGLMITESINSFTFIVPDDLYESIKKSDSENKISSLMMYKYKVKSKTDIEQWEKETDQSQIIFWAEKEKNQFFKASAPVILSMAFVIITLLILSMSVIALKITSEIPDDRIKYQKLYEIGIRKKELKKTLLRQNTAFFMFPLIQPMVFEVFVSKYICDLVNLATYLEVSYLSVVAVTYIIIGLVFSLYMTIAYLFMKKKIIIESEQRKL